MKKIIFIAILLIPSYALALGAGFVGLSGGASGAVCSASYGSELITGAICTAPTGISEGDATTGWAATGITLATNGTAHLGDFALSATADSNFDRFSYPYTGLSLSASTVYRATAYIRHNGTATNNGDWKCALWSSDAAGTAWNGTKILLTKANTTYAQYTSYFYYNSLQDTLVCQENNGDNDGGLYVDELSVTAATLCYGDELHTNSNAASIGSEANATTGFTAINSLNSFTSDADAADGDYAIKADATTNPANTNGFSVDLSAAPFSATNDKKYFISFKAKHIGAGDSWNCGFVGSVNTSPSPNYEIIAFASANTTYAHYGFGFTYDANHKYFVCAEGGTNNNGGIYLDTFSLREIVDE